MDRNDKIRVGLDLCIFTRTSEYMTPGPREQQCSLHRSRPAPGGTPARAGALRASPRRSTRLPGHGHAEAGKHPLCAHAGFVVIGVLVLPLPALGVEARHPQRPLHT